MWTKLRRKRGWASPSSVQDGELLAIGVAGKVKNGKLWSVFAQASHQQIKSHPLKIFYAVLLIVQGLQSLPDATRLRVQLRERAIAGTGKGQQDDGKGHKRFEFRVSGFGFRVSGFGFRVSGFGFRVSGFEFWVSGHFLLSSHVQIPLR
jgi:hypothetical protein